MKSNFPKVLIVGQFFELRSGGGITMTNLFKGWDKSRIAVAAENVKNPDYTVCENYFQLGYSENKRRFPFSLWQKKDLSGLIVGKINNNENVPMPLTVENSLPMALYNKFLHLSGVYHYTRRLKPSEHFIKWMQGYQPDIIYTQLSSLELINFVLYIHENYKIPFIIHIMDDWPSTIGTNGLLQFYWNKIINKRFRLMISKAMFLMGISDAMCEEYEERYHKKFVPFHNPINIIHWLKDSKNDYSFDKPFIVLYAGRIGTGIQECFYDIATALNEVVLKGLKIEFHLQSTSNCVILEDLLKYDFVKVKKPVSYEALPALFSGVDLLLLPNDFDSKSVSFLKYSMPTKASEYMATGTPILVYANQQTALAIHAQKNKWAYVVTDNKIEKLANAFEELYNDIELRRKLGSLAKQYAIENFSDVDVNIKFRKAFVEN